MLKKLVRALDTRNLIHQTSPRSKGRRSRSQGQMKIMHKDMKYIPQTLSDSGNSPVL